MVKWSNIRQKDKKIFNKQIIIEVFNTLLQYWNYSCQVSFKEYNKPISNKIGKFKNILTQESRNPNIQKKYP